ncbi:MAG: hypothetical protein AAFR87_13650 [Bacteroidota bacterium]
MSSRLFFHIFLLLSLISLGFYGCEPIVPGSQSGNNSSGKSTEITEPLSNLIGIAENFSVEAQELSKPGKVRSWVDGLIVTQQPGMRELEVGKMKNGEEAEFLYQRTLRKVKRNLRGQDFYERYILIRMKDGQMGWVHEGGVRYIRPAFENLINELLTNPSDPNKRTRGPGVSPSMDYMVIPGQRVGPIRKSTSEQDLLQIYGAGQVHRGYVATYDNPQRECTVVYPATPNEIKIVWENADRSRIKEIHFLKESSNWFTPEGLTTGMDFSEVIKANKAPISIYGFKWEYSGTVNSWGKGSISRYNNKFYTVFSPRIPIAQVPAKFIGNKVLSSNATDLDAIYPYLEKMVVYLD